MKAGRGVLRRLQKTGSVEAEVTSCGKLFQSLLPATGKAQSPMVTSRVGRTLSKADDDERRCAPTVGVGDATYVIG